MTGIAFRTSSDDRRKGASCPTCPARAGRAHHTGHVPRDLSCLCYMNKQTTIWGSDISRKNNYMTLLSSLSREKQLRVTLKNTIIMKCKLKHNKTAEKWTPLLISKQNRRHAPWTDLAQHTRCADSQSNTSAALYTRRTSVLLIKCARPPARG